MNSSDDLNGAQLPSRLTLKTVWDIREGKEIDAVDFFKQPEGEIMNIRRQLELARSTNKPLFVCPYCRQMVRLSGRKTERGQVSFFSHLYDSDACFIKTTTGMTKEQIEASKYGLVSESDRHKRLKGMIADSLRSVQSIAKGISQVQVEKRIDSPLPYMNWRRPDVQAKFGHLDLVFELQLSTTFISTIVDRDIFYRLNGYFIIWVFNFEANQEYVNLRNLMCKDIYYANKRNIFIFDTEAQQKSIEKGELILKCNWLDPDNTWHFSHAKNHQDGILVSLDQLHYDYETGKPFYYDADAEYFKIHPEILEKRKHWEMSREDIIRALMEKESKERDLFEGQNEQLREEARQTMVQVGAYASIYTKHNRVGLSHDGVILVPPIYSSISEYNSYGYAIASNNKHQGVVDKLGHWIIPCEANEVRFLSSDIIIYRKNPYWFLVGASHPIAPVGDYSSITLTAINDRVSRISFGTSDRRAYVLLMDRFVVFEEKKGRYTIMDFAGREPIQLKDPIIDLDFRENLIFVGVKIKSDVDNHKRHSNNNVETYYGIYDYGLKEIVKPNRGQTIAMGIQDQIVINCGHHSGVISDNGDIIVPFEYSEIKPMGEFFYKAKKAFVKRGDNPELVRYAIERNGRRTLSKWGILSRRGKVILSFEYDAIGDLLNNCFRIKMKHKWGIMNLQLKTVIPCIYEDIYPWGRSLFVVTSFDRRFSYWDMVKLFYLINDHNTRIDDREYRQISDITDNRAYAVTSDGAKVVIDADGQVVAS